MTGQSETSWYVEDNLGQSIQNAKVAGISEERIFCHLQTRTDFPENRIQAVINAVDMESAEENGAANLLSQAPSTDASPRPVPPRRFGVSDVMYLSDREFARTLGLTLEQFDGNTVRPLATGTIEVDLFWNRQHKTVGIRAVVSESGMVGADHVTPLLEGNTVSEQTRNPSRLAAVTNGRFSDEAKQTAQDNNIWLFDSGHLRRWFRRARIPLDAAGTALEQGEDHDGPLDELVTLPTPPEPRCGANPLELERVAEEKLAIIESETRSETRQDTTTAQTDRTSIPADDEQPSPGEKGVLYADPDEDGDYQAFDDYIEEL